MSPQTPKLYSPPTPPKLYTAPAYTEQAETRGDGRAVKIMLSVGSRVFWAVDSRVRITCLSSRYKLAEEVRRLMNTTARS